MGTRPHSAQWLLGFHLYQQILTVVYMCEEDNKTSLSYSFSVMAAISVFIFLCEFGDAAILPLLATPPTPGFSMLLVSRLSREKTGLDPLDDVNALLSSRSKGATRGTLLGAAMSMRFSCSSFLAPASSPHKPPVAEDCERGCGCVGV